MGCGNSRCIPMMIGEPTGCETCMWAFPLSHIDTSLIEPPKTCLKPNDVLRISLQQDNRVPIIFLTPKRCEI